MSTYNGPGTGGTGINWFRRLIDWLLGRRRKLRRAEFENCRFAETASDNEDIDWR